MRITTSLAFALLAAAMALHPVAAVAAGEATKTQTFDVQSINSLILKAGVGDVRVELSTDDRLEARVTLRAQRMTGFFSSLPDVSKLEISATTRGDQLELDIDSDNVEERWELRLPAKLLSAVELMVGVGDVKIVAPAKRIEVDLGVGDLTVDVATGSIVSKVGVGDIRIKTPLANAGAVESRTGVGDVSLRGFFDGTVRNAAAGGRVNGKGRGQQPIEATAGVGDITIELTE